LDTGSARQNLLSILTARSIDARNVHGMTRVLAAADPAVAAVQRCVCLTETPIEHTWMMCRPIANRQNQFSPYGLAFPKAWARRSGVNPVWYLDITPGHDFLTRPINDLIEIAGLGEARAFVADGRSGKLLARVSAARSQVARLAPFIEMMGTYNGESPYRKEFWWEREWRKVGRLQFAWSNVVAVFAPESDHRSFVSDLTRLAHIDSPEHPPLLDPSWGIERMIASLRGLSSADAGPFPP